MSIRLFRQSHLWAFANRRRVTYREATERNFDDSFLLKFIRGFLFWRLANDVAGAVEQKQIFR